MLGGCLRLSRLAGRESSALLLAGGVLERRGDQQPDFGEDGRQLVTRSGGSLVLLLPAEEEGREEGGENQEEVVQRARREENDEAGEKVGDDKDKKKVQVREVTELEGEDRNDNEEVQVCVGNAHWVVLAGGRVYLQGSNQFGQLGLPSSELQQQEHFSELDLSFLGGEKIRQVDTGVGGVTALLTEKGEVWTAGEGSGRVPPPPPEGSSSTEAYATRVRLQSAFLPIPVESFGGEAVKFMSHGGSVSLYITMSGKVFVTGMNSCYEGDGMLGQGDKQNVDVPQYSPAPIKVESLQQQGIRAVSGCAGRMWAVIIDDCGRMFGWGSNRMGQLGLGSSIQDQHVPTVIPIDEGETVLQVSCSWSHTLALTSTGKVYSFGDNSYGQLGRLTSTSTSCESGDAVLKSHSVPGFMDLSMISASYLSTGGQTNVKSVYVTSVHAGGWHSLLVLRTETEVEDKTELLRAYSSCGLARHGGLGSWDFLEEVSTGQYKIVNLCRKLPVIIDTNGGGIGVENIGSVICVPSEAPPETKRRRVRGVTKNLQNDDDSDEDEDFNDGMNEVLSDDDSCVSLLISLDYSDVPTDDSNVSRSFSDMVGRVLGHCDLTTDETSDGNVELCICNHYGCVHLEEFISSLNDPLFLSVMQRKLSSITFVSCNLMFCNSSQVEEFSDALALYPNLSTFTTDMSSFYFLDSTALANGSTDNSLLGHLYSSILRKVPSICGLSVESLNLKSIQNVCEACEWRWQIKTEASDTSHDMCVDLEVRDAKFGKPGFQLLANLIRTTSILVALRLPESSHISDDAAVMLAYSLSVNCSLHTLDLHVTELGHYGVQQKGVKAIVEALEANPDSKLCKLDVSGDDGEPSISRKLQRRLRKCLVRNSTENYQRKYLKYAKLDVYTCHENE